MSFFLIISKVIDTITTTLGKTVAWFTLFMVLVGSYNVIARFIAPYLSSVLSTNSIFYKLQAYSFELQTYAYNLVFLLGAAYVMQQNSHVRVDLIFSKLSAKARAYLDIFGAILLLIPFCSLGIFLSRKYVVKSWQVLEQSPNLGGLPRYPMKTMILAAFALLILQAISETIKNIAFIRGHPNSNSMHAAVNKEN